MNHLHTRTRRLAAAILLVGGVALGLTLSAFSANAHRSGSSGYAVSYYHHSTLLGSTTLANSSSLDAVWKNAPCSKGYGSPPMAFTWSGGSTGVTSAPIIGPCGHAPGSSLLIGPDDFVCMSNFPNPPLLDCRFTWKASSGSANTSAKVANPGGGTTGNVYLYGRTVLYAYLITPGKPLKKISVPAGADTIKFAPAP